MGLLQSDNLRKISQGSASQSVVPWFGMCPEHSVCVLASIRKSSPSPVSRIATVMPSIVSENCMYLHMLYAYCSATPYLILGAKNPCMLHVYITSQKCRMFVYLCFGEKNKIDSIQQILEEEESSLVEVFSLYLKSVPDRIFMSILRGRSETVKLSPDFKLNKIDYVMRYSMLTKGF